MNKEERSTLEQNSWYLGTVLRFNNNKGNGFGSVLGEAIGFDMTYKSVTGDYIYQTTMKPWKREYSFHFKNGHPVVSGSREIVILICESLKRKPKKDDHILFRLVNGSNGVEVDSWCFLGEYKKAKADFDAGRRNACYDRDNLDRKSFGEKINLDELADRLDKANAYEMDQTTFEIHLAYAMYMLKVARTSFLYPPHL